MSIQYIEARIRRYQEANEPDLVALWKAALRLAQIEIPKDMEE